MFAQRDPRRSVWAGALLTLAAELAFAGGTGTGLVPITQLPPTLYQGTFEGGLYPAGSNTIPAAHLALGQQAVSQIVPRDAAGAADPKGWIVMISIGMSNTTHEFGPFERQEDLNTDRNARLVILNGAHGGQTASAIAVPTAPYWTLIDERLAGNNLSRNQVQVAWIKEANAQPPNNFPTHAQELSANLRTIVRNMLVRYPNLKACYLSSRIYGGYAGGTLNPEPQAYEGAFSVKWLVADQINGAADLNADPLAGPVMAPWLAWGPYLWADGLTPRADGLIWLQSDLEGDGTHPSASGEQKTADLLSAYFGTAPTTPEWFGAKPGVGLLGLDATDDAHVSQTQPAVNFGGSPDLTLSGQTSEVYVRFDAGAITSPIFRAKLSFRAPTNGGSPRAQVFLISDASWNESTITWNTAPGHEGTPIITTGQVSRDGSISADVTAAVNADADRVLSFALRAVGNPVGGYLSGESGQPPRLILTVATPVGGPDDFDIDGDVDLTDYGGFHACVTGIGGGPLDPFCQPGDSDGDGDLDFVDFQQFQLVFTGPP